MKKFLLMLITLLIFTGCGETQIPENNLKVASAMNIKISVGGKTFDAVLEDNAAAQEFYKMLPLEITMNELNGNEKYYRFNKNLPSNDRRAGTINAGDLMLWSSNTVVLFYESFSSGYSYTRLGKILNTNGLSNAVGKNNVTVKFEK